MPPLRNLDSARELIEEIHQLFRSRKGFRWGICSRETDEVFGTCTLFNVDLGNRRAEVGFALSRNAWGHGLATEALEVLIKFVFDTLDLHRLEADVDPKNERSLQVLERQGFRREGYLRERWHQLGNFHDTVLLGLLQRDWSRTSMAQPGGQRNNFSVISNGLRDKILLFLTLQVQIASACEPVFVNLRHHG